MEDASRHVPAPLAALDQAREVRGKEVIDVNGNRLGRVTSALAEEGALLRFDVTLTHQARRTFRTDRDVAAIPAVLISDVDEDRVLLSEPGEAMLEIDP
ncbi:MAG TPA: PRC-barrel domain-containing protein [Candidatus Thermoplasmatota archaeon]|nr:PRC-barrel domain-containing protein [Candidatus Thermoplasmatota archaeon]